VTAAEKEAAIARLAEAFDVAGTIGPDAPTLVLRMSEKWNERADEACIEDCLRSPRAVCPRSVRIVPHEWTQEQIDAEAIRVAVQEERDRSAAASLGGENAGLEAFSRLLAAAVEAEREACATIAKAHHDALDPDDDSSARNEAGAIEVEIRERGKVGAS